MLCTLCRRPSRVWYCSHCVNTSPNLILRYKLELCQVHEDLNKIKDTVSTTLESAIGKKEGILGKHMDRLQQLQLKRHNTRMARRVREMGQYLERKSERRDELKAMLAEPPSSATRPDISDSCQEYIEVKQKYDQLQNVVRANSSLKFRELCQWFAITESRDNKHFPYSIRFIPMCNIRHWHETETSRHSLQHMWEFVALAGQVLLVDIPYTSPYNPHSDDPKVTISHLIINMLLILTKLKLVSDPPELNSLLSTYDVDSILYSLCSKQCLRGAKGSLPLSYRTVHKLVLNIEHASGPITSPQSSTDAKANWTLLK
ncbi:HBL110Cp [Eremothecium sinecaudum]|uniref:Autophagy-related protein 14 n=1 Tax=Eremothecium sinecaudum TaxID=45286 RepID=A0A109UWV1_9SACH|nr:HBL110Cp [Eremothecium sinecaudum]AMD18792.1 HBL110Cp [Eremothecium sinecaudum]